MPLPSAGAHLAFGLLTLGLETALAASLLEHLAGARRAGGGWSDGEDPAELMTTFAVADLLAFLDLAGFKEFNDRFGQDVSDECIMLLAEALDTIPGTRAVRDGGDEFLILGAPTDVRLEERLRAFLEEWPAVFRARFGGDARVVSPRVCLTTGRGGALRDMREALGRAITALKREAPVPGPSGALKRV